MPSIQTSYDSIESTSTISNKMDFDSLCFRGQNDNDKTDIQVFVDYIHKSIKLNTSNIAFRMTYYLPHNFFSLFMNDLEKVIQSTNTQNSMNFKKIKMIYKLSDFTTFNITLNNIDELKYAKGLLFVYKNYVEPFMNQLNYTQFDHQKDNYYRFFYIIRKIFLIIF
jgi:hypothetical protein